MPTVTSPGQNGTTGNVASIAVSSVTAAAGGLMIALVLMDDPSALGAGWVTDSGSNTYTLSANTTCRWNTSSCRMGIYYSVLGTALSAGSVTFDPVIGNTALAIILGYLDAPAASPFDVDWSEANQDDATPDLGATPPTTTNANDIAFAGYAWRDNSIEVSSAPTSYTQLGTTQDFSSGITHSAALFYRQLSATGSQNPQLTLVSNPGTDRSAGCITCMKYTSATPTSGVNFFADRHRSRRSVYR